MAVFYIYNMTKHYKTNYLKYPRTKQDIGQSLLSLESHTSQVRSRLAQVQMNGN